jgi:hypothetical protein
MYIYRCSICFILLYKRPDRQWDILLNNLPYNKDPNDPYMYCPHPYSLHFSDDIHGLGSKDLKDVHRGCTLSILMAVNVHARVSNHR